jgi:hypothetical protein
MPAPTQVQAMRALIRLEDVRVYAYGEAVASGRLGAATAALAERFRAYSQARSDALRTGLEALGGGLDGPEPLDLTGDPLVSELQEAGDEATLLRILARLERVAVDTCARAQARLEVPELMQTVASAMGGHAQQLATLRTALDEEPV